MEAVTGALLSGRPCSSFAISRGQRGAGSLEASVVAEQTILDGKYRLVRPAGTGGTARVYLAEDTKTGERVAVKVLRRELLALARACGEAHPAMVTAEHFEFLGGAHSTSAVERYEFLPGWSLPSTADQTEIRRIMSREAGPFSVTRAS